MDYAKIWFVFWAVLWTGYFALDGFDLGVGFSGWLAAAGDDERRDVFSSIGPFWDGNEVWLITAGGATFAAFPPVYAGLFSWLYPALLLRFPEPRAVYGPEGPRLVRAVDTPVPPIVVRVSPQGAR